MLNVRKQPNLQIEANQRVKIDAERCVGSQIFKQKRNKQPNLQIEATNGSKSMLNGEKKHTPLAKSISLREGAFEQP